MTKDPPATLDEPDTDCEVIQKLRAENARLRVALRDLIDAYNNDVNPNDRNESAITHACQAYQAGSGP